MTEYDTYASDRDDDPRVGLPVRPGISRKTLRTAGVACLVTAFVVSLVVSTFINVHKHHEAEDAFAARYWLSNVDMDWWGNRVWYTNTEGTQRCKGDYWDDVDELIVWSCYSLVPAAPVLPR